MTAVDAAPRPTTIASAASTPSTASGAAEQERWTGNWTSPACGERTYERVLHLEAGGRFTSEDLVSVCPPKAKCVWSGIINGKGSWQPQGAGIVLSLEEPKTPRSVGKPFPKELTWDVAASGPAEVDGAGLCSYKRR